MRLVVRHNAIEESLLFKASLVQAKRIFIPKFCADRPHSKSSACGRTPHQRCAVLLRTLALRPPHRLSERCGPDWLPTVHCNRRVPTPRFIARRSVPPSFTPPYPLVSADNTFRPIKGRAVATLPLLSITRTHRNGSRNGGFSYRVYAAAPNGNFTDRTFRAKPT